MTPPLIAGVELGGTKVVCILATGPGDVRDEARIDTTTPDQTLARVTERLELWRRGPGFAAVGVAGFGPLDVDPASSAYGRVVTTPKPGWSGTDLLAPLRDLGVPIGFGVDVEGAALAEGRWGAARGLDAYAYVTVGTGIGVGSVAGGRILRGIGHAEAGHMRVPRLKGHESFPGVCPYHGDCLEGLASGPSIRARAGAPAETLAADHPAWAEPVHALAMMCHNLVLTSLPRRVLIGGGVGLAQTDLLARVRRALVASLAGYGPGATAAADIEAFIAPPGLGARAGPLGAVALGLDRLAEARGD